MSRPDVKIEMPCGGRLLLHACCAPCAGAVVECLDANGIKPVVFYSNSNISTRGEYDKRLKELQRYCNLFGLEVIDDTYDHDAWLKAVKGFENEPEMGGRCARCFAFRLKRAADYAAANGFDVLATTLASSRWKSIEQVDEAGLKVTAAPVTWWSRNWRKGGLQPRRSEIIKEQNFYNQTFCGCEFSQRHDTVPVTED